MRHTPEPWSFKAEVAYGRDIYAGNIWVGDAHNSHGAQNRSGFPTNEECLANARLFTAAPNLLEACKFFMECLDQKILVRSTENDADNDFYQRMANFVARLKKAQQAIVKAEPQEDVK